MPQIDFRQYLKRHIREATVVSYLKRLDRLSRITNLEDAEKVKNIICYSQARLWYKKQPLKLDEFRAYFGTI